MDSTILLDLLSEMIYIKVDYVETCNYDSAIYEIQWFPSHCCCRSLALYHIRTANYGQDVKLDGINIIYTIFFQKLFVNMVLCSSYLLQKMQISNKDEFY
jgi:hypothetical protein